MMTRRIGAAWDTAQKSVLVQGAGLLTLIVRLERDRQKFTSALQSVPLAVVWHWS